MYTVEIQPKENVRSVTAKKTEFSNKNDLLNYLYGAVEKHSSLDCDANDMFLDDAEKGNTREDFGDVFISVTHS